MKVSGVDEQLETRVPDVHVGVLPPDHVQSRDCWCRPVVSMEAGPGRVLVHRPSTPSALLRPEAIR